MQKNKKHSGQGMETHNSIGRGSWTHVQNKTEYVHQKNWKDMKSKRLTLSMVGVVTNQIVGISTKAINVPIGK